VKILTSVVIAGLLLAGCTKKNDTPEAIKQGVLRDISKSFNVSNMDVVVDSVSFRDKEADATVTYTLKGGSAAQGMTMRYVMERHDDGQWYIKSRASSAGGPGGAGAGGDGAAGALPAGHPTTPGAGAEGAAAASGSKLNLPPGHPDLGQ
jgi:hypothetical protein